MISGKVRFTEPSHVAEFVKHVSKFDVDIDIIDNSTMLDGKSLQGLYTIQLGKVLICNMHGSMQDTQELRDEIKGFIVDDFGETV